MWHHARLILTKSIKESQITTLILIKSMSGSATPQSSRIMPLLRTKTIESIYLICLTRMKARRKDLTMAYT